MQVWLDDSSEAALEGVILGFDEYMNLVLDEAEEVAADGRTSIGRIMLKGDAITLIRNAAA